MEVLLATLTVIMLLSIMKVIFLTAENKLLKQILKDEFDFDA
jgi:hypothetical protein